MAATRIDTPIGTIGLVATEHGLRGVYFDGRRVRPEGVLGTSRRGRRLVFSGDTLPAESVLHAARDADLLVHEASFVAEDAERARETAHSTAAQAAALARDAGVRLLALTHLGQRAHPRDVKAEARSLFAATVVPRDFDIIDVPLPERGPPALVRGAGVGWAERRDASPPAEPEDERPKGGGGHRMSGLVTVAVAGDVVEADEIRGVLERAGIEVRLEGAENEAAAVPLDGPCRVLVPDALQQAALDALAEADEEEQDGAL
jgi:ribonuclease Z